MSTHDTYYVPAQSKWPIIATLGMLITVYGLAVWFNDLKAARPESHGPWIFFVGGLLLAYMLFGWFGAVIKESRAGLYSPQMDRSFRWGMTWFIFSEVMFFVAFFGALFYVRHMSGPWLGGEGHKGIAHMLWPNFEFTWPLLNNPDPKMYPAPEGTISPWGLPLVNTILLVSSSVTITLAHHALRKGHRGALKIWLALTVLLGWAFLGFQAEEYMHAYKELGLTLGSGVYGATFFMLTGFHGAHVTIGTIILFVMLMRILRGHFNAEHQFGFEAASWYWHFVDVVWIGLFFFVYVLSRALPRCMRYQLAAEKAPGDQPHGDRGQHHTHSQGSDEAVGVALVLDQKEQATEQAHDSRDQHQGNDGFEHGLAPMGRAGNENKYSQRHETLSPRARTDIGGARVAAVDGGPGVLAAVSRA